MLRELHHLPHNHPLEGQRVRGAHQAFQNLVHRRHSARPGPGDKELAAAAPGGSKVPRRGGTWSQPAAGPATATAASAATFIEWEGPSEPGRGRAILGRRKAAGPRGPPQGPEVRIRLPRWARDLFQPPGAGTLQAELEGEERLRVPGQCGAPAPAGGQLKAALG
uniref:Uncharacterized protein n=1 Tax=Mus spicilegus TaxID=10103 RepID=A0A8C6N3Y8_MUSSI